MLPDSVLPACIIAGAVGLVVYMSKQQQDLFKSMLQSSQQQADSRSRLALSAESADMREAQRVRTLEREFAAVAEQLAERETDLLSLRRELEEAQLRLERALRRESRASQYAMGELQSKEAEIGEAAHFFKAIESETMKIERKIAVQQHEYRTSLNEERSKSQKLEEDLHRVGAELAVSQAQHARTRSRGEEFEERVLKLEQTLASLGVTKVSQPSPSQAESSAAVTAE